MQSYLHIKFDLILSLSNLITLFPNIIPYHKFHHIPYRTKLWWGENFGEFGESSQFAKFFANILDEARGHAVCVVNVRHVKQGT